MIAEGRQELICDLAETYGIYDYRQLPPMTVAALSVGLRDDSRIKMKMTDSRLTIEQMLMAIIADRLGSLMNAMGGNVDFSIYDKLMGLDEEEQETETIVGQVYGSVEEFTKVRYGG